MIPELPSSLMPDWLLEILKEDGVTNALLPPLESILKDSLYYPASGLNGTPVKYLAGNIYSFIYADYSITKAEFLRNLNGHGADCGFKHYHSVAQREVFRKDIVPTGWYPPIVPTGQREVKRLMEMEIKCKPFGHWSVWKRNSHEEENVGPEGFSFLFFAGEMSAIYQGLYCRLKIAPKILSIIQPGAIGGEWEGVTSNKSFFKKVVLSNSAGLPQFLLHGGFGYDYEQACWDEYAGNRLAQLSERHAGLWKLNS